ncbi:MAG: sodium:calcium symporter, partial [Kiritimatiellae bacterium]|nr:sodium:calcium symporter [Kiritimatiellia bacterium]
MALVMVARVFTLGAPVNPDWTIGRSLGFLWIPDFSALKSGKVWLEAAGQVFFSTSVGIGVLLTYATYMKRDDDVILPATTASFLNTFVEIVLGASIVIPAAFVFFGPAGATTAVAGGTFGLAFQTTPLVFNHMAGGPVIGFVWFLLLFTAGVTSAVSMLQPGVAFLEEEFGFNRKRCILVLGGFTFLVAHLVIFGNGVLDEMDFWFSSFGLPLFALFEALVFACAFGRARGWQELKRDSALRLPGFFNPVVFFVTPLLLIAILAGWFVTDGWKTVLMLKSSESGLVPLYAKEQVPWVIATRLFYLAFIAGFCWLTRRAWQMRSRNGAA